ncbi:MAG: hypothetical protein MPEBLZ_01864 [Candidatus Methanoperedens nitroreducens]|uniref:DUF2281 domain-containing protein n=1 Tax=Candidatus Methanoperedens nitratireducens TaxID=1392998 RepID=A0A0P8AAN4_9EURY|nr:hypothetical protein [Candidatus Methanoperedens sp. BLZ2]KPQ43677.1 MAG: hypothetical protein MPEBLZ_01864 [Candidatus Methanoperedens sp. BLZ1]MCX9078539.1 hypothetical protein [Candidatus Methanoperedens sp.]
MANLAKKELIMREMEHIPEPLFNEILDFIYFLKTKALKEKLETAIASESSLKKDWLREEEDNAWQDL